MLHIVSKIWWTWSNQSWTLRSSIFNYIWNIPQLSALLRLSKKEYEKEIYIYMFINLKCSICSVLIISSFKRYCLLISCQQRTPLWSKVCNYSFRKGKTLPAITERCTTTPAVMWLGSGCLITCFHLWLSSTSQSYYHHLKSSLMVSPESQWGGQQVTLKAASTSGGWLKEPPS